MRTGKRLQGDGRWNIIAARGEVGPAHGLARSRLSCSVFALSGPPFNGLAYWAAYLLLWLSVLGKSAAPLLFLKQLCAGQGKSYSRPRHCKTTPAMGAIKRKADQGATPQRKERDQPKDRSAKRQRKSDAQDLPAAATAAPKPKPDISTHNSIFKDEEKSFPRGGASLLTPLEHKQIQIKANQDVLFEQTGQKKRGGDDGMSDEGSEFGGDDDAPKSAKKRKSKKSKAAAGDDEQVQKIKAEGLTFKVCFFATTPPPTANLCRTLPLAPSCWARSSMSPPRTLPLPCPTASWATCLSPPSPTSSTSG